MKIISWNVNGIRACAKKGLLEFVEQQDPDIFCIQETKAHPQQVEPELLTLAGRHSYWSSANRKGYSGTATFVRSELEQVSYGIGIKKFDSEGRFVVTSHKDFDLYNVYFPNGASGAKRLAYKMEFLSKFMRHLRRELKKGKNIIVLGDYNIAHNEIDVFDPVRLSTESGFLPEERAWMTQFLEAGFVDTFRFFHKEEKHRYTWWSYRERARDGNRGWRIDVIGASTSLEKRLKKAEILDQQLGSDHCPILLEIE